MLKPAARGSIAMASAPSPSRARRPSASSSTHSAKNISTDCCKPPRSSPSVPPLPKHSKSTIVPPSWPSPPTCADSQKPLFAHCRRGIDHGISVAETAADAAVRRLAAHGPGDTADARLADLSVVRRPWPWGEEPDQQHAGDFTAVGGRGSEGGTRGCGCRDSVSAVVRGAYSE